MNEKIHLYLEIAKDIRLFFAGLVLVYFPFT